MVLDSWLGIISEQSLRGLCEDEQDGSVGSGRSIANDENENVPSQECM